VPHCSVGPPMPGPWALPLMMFPPCSPWTGWYGPWVPPPTHFHPRWSGPAQGFSHGGYYTGDDCYGHISHQQGREASGQENWTIQNAKPDHPVSQEAVTAVVCQQGQRASNEPPVDHLCDSQEKTWPDDKSLANDEVKSDVRKNPEEVATEQSKIPGAKIETRTEAGISSRRPQSRTVRFPKLDHPVSAASG
jgi:hypothetical protein